MLVQSKESYGFISISKLREWVTPAAVENQLAAKGISLSASLDSKLISRSRKLIAVLILLGLETYIEDVTLKGVDDEIFPASQDHITFLNSGEDKYRFCLEQWVIPSAFSPNQHMELRKEAILPFLNKTRVSHGSFGIVYRVRIAEGHIDNYGVC
jgi:hypothetical protein